MMTKNVRFVLVSTTAKDTNTNTNTNVTKKEEEKREMTEKEKMLKKIDEIDSRRFYLAMKDFWSNADFRLDRELLRERTALEKKVKEME